jgi:hypothetical protein
MAKAKPPPLASSSGARRRFDESKERIAKKEREDKQASLKRSLQRRIDAKEVAPDGSPLKRPAGAGAGAGVPGLSSKNPLPNKQAADVRMKGMPAGTVLYYTNRNGKVVRTKPQAGMQAGKGRTLRKRQMAQKQPPKRNPGPPPGPPPGAKL